MSAYLIKPGEVWTFVEPDGEASVSSGGCAACSHADGESPLGRYMETFWTDLDGAGDVLCAPCYHAADDLRRSKTLWPLNDDGSLRKPEHTEA